MEQKLIKVDSLVNSLQSFLGEQAFADASYVMLQCTDKFLILQSSELADNMGTLDISHALEIRLFSEAGEVKWVRDSIADEDFICREKLVDQTLTKDVDYWDEEQYLDIDTKRSKVSAQKVVTTGGGRYTLPVIGQKALARANGISENTGKQVITDYNDLKIVIRNYLDYEPETGRVFVADWRIVGFVKEK